MAVSSWQGKAVARAVLYPKADGASRTAQLIGAKDMKRILTAAVLAFSFAAFAGDAAPAGDAAKPAEVKTEKKKTTKKDVKKDAAAPAEAEKPADMKPAETK
jgi:hypothetical protein